MLEMSEWEQYLGKSQAEATRTDFDVEFEVKVTRFVPFVCESLIWGLSSHLCVILS